MIKYPSLYKFESDFYTQSLYQLVIQRTILPNLQHYNGGRKKTIMGHVPYQEGEGEYL